MFGTDCKGIEIFPYDYPQHQKEVEQMGSTGNLADHFRSLALFLLLLEKSCFLTKSCKV